MKIFNLKKVNSKSKKEYVNLFFDLLKNGKTVRTKSLGESMYPAIQMDDYLIIKPIEFKDVKTGDIIAYKKNKGDGLLTGHRVVAKKNDFIITKGDVNRFSDFPVYPDEICGKIIQIERANKVINLETALNKVISLLWAKFSFFRDKIITKKNSFVL